MVMDVLVGFVWTMTLRSWAITTPMKRHQTEAALYPELRNEKDARLYHHNCCLFAHPGLTAGRSWDIGDQR